MRTEGFESALEARQELWSHDFTMGFSSPGRPQLWAARGASKRDYRAIARRGDEWVIVPYPVPATCRPDQLAELQARDKIAGYEDDVVVFNDDEDEEAAAREELKRMGVL